MMTFSISFLKKNIKLAQEMKMMTMLVFGVISF